MSNCITTYVLVMVCKYSNFSDYPITQNFEAGNFCCGSMANNYFVIKQSAVARDGPKDYACDGDYQA